MMRVKVRRNPPKNHKARRALLAVGALGATAEGIRRWRHRHDHGETEPVEH